LVILLEEKGTLRNSVEFASFLERTGGIGKELVFVIGGGLGLHPMLKLTATIQCPSPLLLLRTTLRGCY